MSQQPVIVEAWVASDSTYVLVVDDDPDVLELLKLTLESEGYQVATAATAAEALHIIEGAVAGEAVAEPGGFEEPRLTPADNRTPKLELQSIRPIEDDSAPATTSDGANPAAGAGGAPEAPDSAEPSPAATRVLPDLVLLDINLPDQSGVSVCEAVRAMPACERLPIILISADATEDVRVRGLEAGANDFIAKPFYPRELLAKVYRCLESSHETQRLEKQSSELAEVAEQRLVDLSRTERELKKQLYSNQTLMALCQQLAGSLKLDELLNTFMLMVLGQLGARSVALFMPADNTASVLLPCESKGVVPQKLQGLCVNVKDDFGRYLAERNAPVHLNKLLYRPGFRMAVERMLEEGFELIDGVVIDGRLAVVVLMGSALNEREYNADDCEIFDSLCRTAAVAIENAKLFKELRETCLGIIRTLLSTLEAKDPYTRGHTERVAMYSTCIAEEMGVSGDGLEDIRFGATLHDVGKLGIMDNVLKKAGALDRDERKHIMSHPARGAAILEGLRFLEPAVDMVLHHHENLDGTGYPDGLEGDEIGLGARIVAVSDAFDAMTSGRVYMKAMTVGQAIESLRKRAGRQYDGDVIDALERVIQEGKVRLGV